MNALTAILPLLAPLADDDAAGAEIYAYLEADTLEVGGSYELVIGVALPEGANASKSGAPAPFLQLDVPASVKLVGKVLTTHQELAQNEFLQQPFERLLTEPETSIAFELVSPPAGGESIGINVLAYVRPGGEEEAFFLRRRFELPLTPGAVAEPASAEKSDWGVDEKLLQIGDEAVAFELPDAGGVPVSLDEYLGKKNLIVTTYRAHW